MLLAEQIISICWCLFNCLLHGSGIVLLFALYKKNNTSSQKLFLLNLSLTEFLQNACRLPVYVLKFYFKKLRLNPNTSKHVLKVIGNAIIQGQFVLNTGVIYQCLMAMMLLTGDRLMCILLHVRYPVFWSYRKTIVAVALSWGLSFWCTAIVCGYAQHCIDETQRMALAKLDNIVQVHILAALSLLFLIFSMFSYFIMFRKFLISRRDMNTTEAPESEPLSAWKAFCTSKFFVCILLMSSFLFLWVVPTLIVNLWVLTTGSLFNSSLPNLYHYVNISYLLSDTADGVIYVFLKPEVRKLFKKKISCLRRKVHRYQGLRMGGVQRGQRTIATFRSATFMTTTM